MEKKNKKELIIAMAFLVSFVLWTVLIRVVDVKAIGPQKSSVGFATLNGFFHNLTGVHMSLYTITDWLGLLPFVFVIGFGLLGLIQWIKRKSITRIDYSILILGGFYIVTMAVYILFEVLVINYRPILIDGRLEASYPSSTTMLVMCVMPTALMQLCERIKKQTFRQGVCVLIIVFTIFMVLCRLISGVHWLTDIVGGALFSTGLVMMYRHLVGLNKSKN